MNRFVILLSTALLLAASAASAQNMPKVAWEIEGPDGPVGGPRPPFTVALAQGYTYKVYKVADAASAITLTGIICTTTNDPFIKTCNAPLPSSLDVPGLTLDVTVTVTGIESAHSTPPAMVPQPTEPPKSPTNFRIFRQAITALATTPAKFLRNVVPLR